jgi:hypothetical protein
MEKTKRIRDFLRILCVVAVLGPAIEWFRGTPKGPITTAFLLASSTGGLIGYIILEVIAFLDRPTGGSNEVRETEESSRATEKPETVDPNWMGTREGRSRRLRIVICVLVVGLGIAIALLNVLG